MFDHVLKTLSAASVAAGLLMTPPALADQAPSDVNPASVAVVHHRTMEIQGVEIAYREAGDPSQPTILLLHGFPTSSQMFRGY